MKSKKRVLTLLTIIVVFLISNTSYITFNCNNGNHLKPQKKDQIQIKRSGTWNLTGNPILIDDLDVNLNWSKTALENDWCSGSGTWDNPYKIENVTIDGQSLNSCIEIKNSNVYFIIQNCIVYNSGPSDESGLYLFNVNNSRIINNTCSNNNNYNFGIRLSSSNNITILGNVANNNYHGILLENSNNNTLSYNTANYIINDGIRLYSSNNNTLSGNTVNNNGDGIEIWYSDYNTFSGNIANGNVHGIYLLYSDTNKILGNNANSNHHNGILIASCNKNTISGNTAYSTGYGITLRNSHSNLLTDNNASNNRNDGIHIHESNKNTVSGNTISNNRNYGILLGSGINNSLSGNLMSLCGIIVSGPLTDMVSHNIDITNLVNNKPVYYFVNETGLGSNNFTNAGQIILVNCNNSKISGLNLSYGSVGVFLGYSKNNTILGNTANNNNNRGIDLYLSNNNTVSGNTISNNNHDGINLYSSHNNTISGNTASNNDYYGIHLYASNYNAVDGNFANDSIRGIRLWESNTNKLSENIVYSNYAGLSLDHSNNNTITGNTANYNGDGIRIYYDCTNNLIFLNNFISTGSNARDYGTGNKWDNGSIGNYWYDYVGVDANHDGIGDTPYIIPGTEGSQDNFPIWTDNIAPVFTIIFPLPYSVFGLVVPNYNISIDEPNLDTIWYTLDGGETKFIITSLTGTLNQTAWESLSAGNVIIRFYANDTSGNIGFLDVEVIIWISEDLDDEPAISFGNYFIIFTFISILSLIIIEKRKKK